jgi:hypothetical protein
VEDKSWHIRIVGRRCRDGEPRSTDVTGLVEGSRNLLGSRKYQTVSSFPRFREVMDRMDGSAKGKGTQNKHEAKRCRSAPAPHALSHGNRREYKQDDSQRYPTHC